MVNPYHSNRKSSSLKRLITEKGIGRSLYFLCMRTLESLLDGDSKFDVKEYVFDDVIIPELLNVFCDIDRNYDFVKDMLGDSQCVKWDGRNTLDFINLFPVCTNTISWFAAKGTCFRDIIDTVIINSPDDNYHIVRDNEGGKNIPKHFIMKKCGNAHFMVRDKFSNVSIVNKSNSDVYLDAIDWGFRNITIDTKDLAIKVYNWDDFDLKQIKLINTKNLYVLVKSKLPSDIMKLSNSKINIPSCVKNIYLAHNDERLITYRYERKGNDWIAHTGVTNQAAAHYYRSL